MKKYKVRSGITCMMSGLIAIKNLEMLGRIRKHLILDREYHYRIKMPIFLKKGDVFYSDRVFSETHYNFETLESDYISYFGNSESENVLSSIPEEKKTPEGREEQNGGNVLRKGIDSSGLKNVNGSITGKRDGNQTFKIEDGNSPIKKNTKSFCRKKTK